MSECLLLQISARSEQMALWQLETREGAVEITWDDRNVKQIM
jgi:hypothetical protein